MCWHNISSVRLHLLAFYNYLRWFGYSVPRSTVSVQWMNARGRSSGRCSPVGLDCKRRNRTLAHECSRGVAAPSMFCSPSFRRPDPTVVHCIYLSPGGDPDSVDRVRCSSFRGSSSRPGRSRDPAMLEPRIHWHGQRRPGRNQHPERPRPPARSVRQALPVVGDTESLCDRWAPAGGVPSRPTRSRDPTVRSYEYCLSALAPGPTVGLDRRITSHVLGMLTVSF